MATDGPLDWGTETGKHMYEIHATEIASRIPPGPRDGSGIFHVLLDGTGPTRQRSRTRTEPGAE